MQPDGHRAASGPNPTAHTRSKWTRAEWILLAAGAVVLLSTIWPAIAAFHMRRRIAMARHDIAALQRAIVRYHREYGNWPAATDARNLDVRFGGRRSNAELIRVLRAESGPGNPNHELNTQRMIFIEIEPYKKGFSGVSPEGEFLDPWGMPYQIALDTSYDNIVQVNNSVYGRVPGVGVLIWSVGPDRKSETRDDLLSWQN